MDIFSTISNLLWCEFFGLYKLDTKPNLYFTVEFVSEFALTGAVGLREDRSVTEVVLQRQVCDTIQTPIGWKAQPQCMARSEHRHQPWCVSVCAAWTAAYIDGGGVRKRDLHCSLRRDKGYSWCSWGYKINRIGFSNGKQIVVVIVHTVLLEVLYVMENDAVSSALMQVEFPWFTSRVTAWMRPVEENIILKTNVIWTEIFLKKYPISVECLTDYSAHLWPDDELDCEYSSVCW